MQIKEAYPTLEHQKATKTILEFFKKKDGVDSVLLVNSCARGKATCDSCLDIAILVTPDVLSDQKAEMENLWQDFYQTHDAFRSLKKVGRYSVVHLDFIDGVFVPEERDESEGPDWFEVEIGNRIAYSVSLWSGSDYLSQLKAKWLPYYDETLRQKRLIMTKRNCLSKLDHIALYAERGLYFHAFDRFYIAFQEFLQALFISHRTYPIAYNKWIREQIEEILGNPGLYIRLPKLFEIRHFESSEVVAKARELEGLLEEYAT
jgi:predicted nucleotidyltransferase